MKKLYVFMAAGALILYAACFWKNSFSYPFKKLQWRVGKSVIDGSLIILAALYAPAVLIGWSVMWLTKPIKRRGVQVTLAIILGIAFGGIAGIALEAMCILAVFSVDMLTGSQGIWGWYQQRIPDNFMVFLNGKNGARKTNGVAIPAA